VLVNAYKIQNSLNKDIYLKAIDNTNVMADMVEEFDLDRSNKYPKLYDDSIGVIKSKLKTKFKKRMSKKEFDLKTYTNRIKYELKTMEDNGSIDYMLIEEDIKSEMIKEGRYAGYSRGSCSGSLIAYILNITDIDSIKYDMSFERFMNSSRVSLCDIDSDWADEDIVRVKEYLHVDMKNKFDNLYTSEIVTFNTIGLKGAIRDIGGALINFNLDNSLHKTDFTKREVLTFDKIDNMSKNIEENEAEYRKKHPKFFKYVDLLNGVITSIGSHPAATIVSPVPLDKEMGTFTLTTNKYPISQLNMKEVDGLNFVKLDVLGLDNVKIINDTCKLANIERLTPDNMDFNDLKVWEHMMVSQLGIFQFQGDFAHSYLKTVFKKENIQKVIDRNPDIPQSMVRLIIMGIANGAIRPSGTSYRDALSKGEFHDNGHKVLNEFLAPTSGYLVFQETIINFLNQFCGFTMAEADTVRRGFAKKTGTEQYIPKIKNGFIELMTSKYNSTKEEANELIEQFLIVIIDASDYIFSKNHADPYSMIGFACAYLRYYHPLEFLTVLLNINVGDMNKTNDITNYIKLNTDIHLSPIQFRYSQSEYAMDKETNSIYKGIQSIKTLGKNVGIELNKFKDNIYDSFIDLLDDVYNYENKIKLENYEKGLKAIDKKIKKDYNDNNKKIVPKEILKIKKQKLSASLTIELNKKIKEFKSQHNTNSIVGETSLE